MCQFNYQFLDPEVTPFITCVVPSTWLSENLPTMGGGVIYVDQLSQEVHTHYIFEFSEVASLKGLRTIILDIRHKKWKLISRSYGDHKKLSDSPIKIYSSNAGEKDGDIDSFINVLLNHLVGSLAMSAITGSQYLDFADVDTVFQMSSEFDFVFGLGDQPSDILPAMFERTLPSKHKCAFLKLFARQGNLRVSHLNDAIGAFDPTESMILVSDVAVDQDKMLISALLGR